MQNRIQKIAKQRSDFLSRNFLKMIAFFLMSALSASVTTSALPGMIHSGIYTINPAFTQPLLSLCNSDSVRVNPDGTIDLCLTINPAFEGKRAKSYTCESLAVSNIGGARFTVGDPHDPCFLKMRAYANSVGISVATPIEFTYWYGADPSGNYNSMGSLSVHLKWTQQSVPFKAHQFDLSYAMEKSLNAVVICVLLFALLSGATL
jgi:hypothetical protein